MYFVKPGASKVILISHGNGGSLGNRMILVAALLCCGANVFVYDYEGYGKSEGKPSISGLIRDGVAAYDFVHNELHYKPSQIVDYGESIGSGVAVQIAKQRTVAGIMLVSGFRTLYLAGIDTVFFVALYPASWFDNLDNSSVLEQPHAPLLVMHGDNDPVLKRTRALELFNEACLPKRYVQLTDFGHELRRIDNMQFLTAVRSFLNELP